MLGGPSFYGDRSSFVLRRSLLMLGQPAEKRGGPAIAFDAPMINAGSRGFIVDASSLSMH
jgi:hypothetical protein